MHDIHTGSHRHAPALARLEAWFGDILAGIRHRRRQRAEYNRVLGELMSLSRRDLVDLDIARADFRRIAEDAARAV